MKVRCKLLQRLHLDRRHGLLTARNCQMVLSFFTALDARQQQGLDDIQFAAFMRAATDLSSKQIYNVFDMFDVDDSGSIDFDEFYLLVCMLIAIKDREEKLFLFRHSRTCFELLDEDASGKITLSEFERFGFVFSFGRAAIKQIFKEFDVSGDKELDYNEFRMFTLACIDKQQELEARRRARYDRMQFEAAHRSGLTGLAAKLYARILSVGEEDTIVRTAPAKAGSAGNMGSHEQERADEAIRFMNRQILPTTTRPISGMDRSQKMML